ncbi:hypothetical protein [Streptomyces sp. R44]|uniref:Uncharacterized protein n=1 Tax=Streptomyces sp. R44 TaxID=3238633 RepID=A0AB39SMT9_9ACTN
MTRTMRVRRLVAGGAASGLLGSGAALGMAGSATAAPAPTSVATTVVHHDDGDRHGHHDRCEWKKGHWEKKRVKHDTWHADRHDHHGKWLPGYGEHHHSYKWVYVSGHWDHVWVKGHWDCHHS